MAPIPLICNQPILWFRVWIRIVTDCGSIISTNSPLSLLLAHPDGYPSNSDETDSFRGVGVERSMSPTRNMSPLVISGPINNGSRVQMLGDQVSVEVKHRTSSNGLTGELLSSAPTPATILAVPNLSQVNHLTATSAATPLPLTAINLSSTANPNNHVPHGVLNIPTPSSQQQQQIFTSATTSFVTSNGQSHVIMKGGHGSGGVSNNTSSSNGFNKGNGLIIKEALPGGGAGKAMKFGHSGADAADQPPTKMVKLVNGSTTTNDLVASQAIMHPHTQVLPIYSSTQNGGLRVIGHHTTTTTSTGGGGHHNNGSMPTSVVFSDPTTKYHQHLSSGMVISAPLGGTLPTNLSHQYLTSASSTGAAQVHKLLLTGMGPNMMAQGIPSGYSLPHMAPMNDMFPRSGSTSLPGGAQLNLCRSTPSPTISISAAAPKGNGPQKGAGGLDDLDLMGSWFTNHWFCLYFRWWYYRSCRNTDYQRPADKRHSGAVYSKWQGSAADSYERATDLERQLGESAFVCALSGDSHADPTRCVCPGHWWQWWQVDSSGGKGAHGQRETCIEWWGEGSQEEECRSASDDNATN